MSNNSSSKKKPENTQSGLNDALRQNLKRRKKVKNKTLLSGVKKAMLLIAVTIFCTGCIKKSFQHGYNLDPVLINEINKGISTKQQVSDLLGSPSVESYLVDDTFVYFGKKFEQVAFLDPEVVEQQVLIIGFDSNGVVDRVVHLTEEEIKQIRIDPSRTRLTGNEMTILEQLLSNVGRFDSSMITSGS